ncbi:MAG: ATP-binding cassette domain-containing protein, partial [Turicibacter sanguinis]
VLSGKETDVPMDNLTLEFKNVSFKYPKSEVNVLNNVNVTILPGEKLSIVGLNGAGKTTFIKLLTRLYEPTEGAIYLNGVNILEYDLKEYLALMSVVFQDFKLFAFSVKDNIVFNQVEKDETIIEVLREADLKKIWLIFQKESKRLFIKHLKKMVSNFQVDKVKIAISGQYTKIPRLSF